MLRMYQMADASALLSLWNTAGVAMGYAPLNRERLAALLLKHPDFSPENAFVWEEAGEVRGFVNGCAGEQLPGGASRGYVTCLLLAPLADTCEITVSLLTALEESFCATGCTHSMVSFFAPIRLPWVIPETQGHQHNNMPGVATDLALYERMRTFGYRETARECAMYRPLADFVLPDVIKVRAQHMAREGYTVARYDPAKHIGLEEMVASLGNPEWSREIVQAGKSGRELLVGLCGNVCAGFAGPIYPEETGRGYFAGIGVSPHWEHHGLGKLLFYRLLEQEKKAGADYMSLFTGENNPAKRIYEEAGFQIVRTFSVLRKEL